MLFSAAEWILLAVVWSVTASLFIYHSRGRKYAFLESLHSHGTKSPSCHHVSTNIQRENYVQIPKDDETKSNHEPRQNDSADWDSEIPRLVETDKFEESRKTTPGKDTRRSKPLERSCNGHKPVERQRATNTYDGIPPVFCVNVLHESEQIVPYCVDASWIEEFEIDPSEMIASLSPIPEEPLELVTEEHLVSSPPCRLIYRPQSWEYAIQQRRPLDTVREVETEIPEDTAANERATRLATNAMKRTYLPVGDQIMKDTGPEIMGAPIVRAEVEAKEQALRETISNISEDTVQKADQKIVEHAFHEDKLKPKNMRETAALGSKGATVQCAEPVPLLAIAETSRVSAPAGTPGSVEDLTSDLRKSMTRKVPQDAPRYAENKTLQKPLECPHKQQIRAGESLHANHTAVQDAEHQILGAGDRDQEGEKRENAAGPDATGWEAAEIILSVEDVPEHSRYDAAPEVEQYAHIKNTRADTPHLDSRRKEEVRAPCAFEEIMPFETRISGVAKLSSDPDSNAQVEEALEESCDFTFESRLDDSDFMREFPGSFDTNLFYPAQKLTEVSQETADAKESDFSKFPSVTLRYYFTGNQIIPNNSKFL